MNIKIGVQLVPQLGDMQPMREAWMASEALGVDMLYSADHFIAMHFDSDMTSGTDEHAVWKFP